MYLYFNIIRTYCRQTGFLISTNSGGKLQTESEARHGISNGFSVLLTLTVQSLQNLIKYFSESVRIQFPFKLNFKGFQNTLRNFGYNLFSLIASFFFTFSNCAWIKFSLRARARRLIFKLIPSPDSNRARVDL